MLRRNNCIIATILRIYWRVRYTGGWDILEGEIDKENEKGLSWQGEPEMRRPVEWERLLSH